MSARRSWPKRWPGVSAAPSSAFSSRRISCRATSPASTFSTSRRSTSSSGRARSWPSWCSPTRSTAPHRKPRRRLLEAMEEAQVTVDGVTHPLPHPFIVLATENPIDYEGTFPAAGSPARPLPDAHLDWLSRPRRASWKCSTASTLQHPLDDLNRSSRSMT